MAKRSKAAVLGRAAYDQQVAILVDVGREQPDQFDQFDALMHLFLDAIETDGEFIKLLDGLVMDDGEPAREFLRAIIATGIGRVLEAREDAVTLEDANGEEVQTNG